MQVITYQIGIGFNFSPILVHHFLNEKPVRRNFPKEKVYTLTRFHQSIKRFRNKDRLLKLYRNKRTKNTCSKCTILKEEIKRYFDLVYSFNGLDATLSRLRREVDSLIDH